MNETRQQPPHIAMPRLPVWLFSIIARVSEKNVFSLENHMSRHVYAEGLFSRAGVSFSRGCRDFPWGCVYTLKGQLLEILLDVYEIIILCLTECPLNVYFKVQSL